MIVKLFDRVHISGLHVFADRASGRAVVGMLPGGANDPRQVLLRMSPCTIGWVEKGISPALGAAGHVVSVTGRSTGDQVTFRNNVWGGYAAYHADMAGPFWEQADMFTSGVRRHYAATVLAVPVLRPGPARWS